MSTLHHSPRFFLFIFNFLILQFLFAQGETPKKEILISSPQRNSLPCDKIPKILCPSNITLCPGASTDQEATGCAKGIPGSLNCDLPIIEHVDKLTSEGPCLGEKVIQRIWTARDPNDFNLKTFCVQYITLEDKEAPTFLNCPHDTTILSNEKCLGLLIWKSPFVSDQCSNFCVESSHINGSAFPIGITKVFFIANDNCGNTSSCGLNVTVIDNCCDKLPIITCPLDYSGCFQIADPNVIGKATAIPGEPNCSTPVITYSDDTLYQSSCSLRIERTWIATDLNNQLVRSTCIQKINLADTEKPRISCPANIKVKSDPDCMALINWNDPIVVDNCSSVSLVSSHMSGNRFSAGITTVFYTATDACGNSIGCQFTITIEANCCDKPPVVLCPVDFNGCPQGIDPSVTGRASALKANKFCTTPTLRYEDDTIYQVACSLRVERKWIATDTTNFLSSTCIQFINLNDTLAPTLEVPQNIVVASASDCFATVNWNIPSTSDNCSNVALEGSHLSGSRFPLGTTTVTYIARDACGNKTTKSFTIRVEDNCCDLPPIINCPSKYIGCPNTSIEPSVTGMVIVNPGSSRCRNPIVTYKDEILHISVCSLSVKRTWTATDSFKTNLASSCIQTIELKDTLAPTVTCPKDIVVLSDENCLAVVEWNDPIVSENCSATTFSSSHGSGAEFRIGVRTIFYTVFDACSNSVGCNFTVTVLDNCCNEPPNLTCPPDFKGCPQGIDPSVTGTAIITPSGNCGKPVLYFKDDTLFNSSCSLRVNRIWIAVDSVNSNLRDSCIQKIDLLDILGPSITCPANITSLSSENCKATVRWNEPTTSDNCSNVTLSGSHLSGSEFPIGDTKVTYSAIDACGNRSTCSFTITVIENCCMRAPKVVCPPDVLDCPGSIEPSRHGFPSVLRGHPTCDEPILTYSDKILNNATCSMRVDRTWLAVDPNNNLLRDSCIQKIELKDLEGPIFNDCPTNFKIVPNYNCEAFPTWTEPTAIDQCRLVSLTRTHAPGSRFLPGVTTVTYIATDACGNTTTCSFNITVTNDCCSKPPIISCPSNFKACPGSSTLPAITGSATASTGSIHCLQPIISYTDKVLSSGPCLGAIVIERTWLAIDPNLSNLWSNCIQRIELSDNEKPVISNMPSNIIIDAKGKCEIPVTWTNPIANDNCSLQSLTSTKLNGSIFNGGITTITYTAVDGCGNSTTSSFKVTITGTEIQIDCPNDTTVVRTNPNLNGVVVNWNLPKAKFCNKCNDSLPGFIYMGEYAGKRYFCSLSPASWFDAKIICKLNGGNLAVIKDKQENQFIASKLMGQTAWIGASDERREGVFEWVDGSIFNYNNWLAGQPNNGLGIEDYVELYPDGFWNDQSGTTSREFICQMPCYTIRQTAGPQSGSVIQCGSNKITYVATKDGVNDTCSFNINVNCDSLSKYCTNKALNTDVMWIDHVSFANIDKVSGDNGGYALFNQPCGELKNNNQYDLCVEPGFKGGLYTVYWKVWIDFNSDAVFQNTELVLLGSGNTGLCGKFSLPTNYVTGPTRMRVIMSYGKYAADACSSILYGEVEDYCINLSRSSNLVTQSKDELESTPQTLKCVRNCKEVKSKIIDLESLGLQLELDDLNVIPNPANNEIQILVNARQIRSINIFDLTGKLVWRKQAPISRNEILDVSKWSEGIYNVVVDIQEESQLSQRIIIQR